MQTQMIAVKKFGRYSPGDRFELASRIDVTILAALGVARVHDGNKPVIQHTSSNADPQDELRIRRKKRKRKLKMLRRKRMNRDVAE